MMLLPGAELDKRIAEQDGAELTEDEEDQADEQKPQDQHSMHPASTDPNPNLNSKRIQDRHAKNERRAEGELLMREYWAAWRMPQVLSKNRLGIACGVCCREIEVTQAERIVSSNHITSYVCRRLFGL